MMEQTEISSKFYLHAKFARALLVWAKIMYILAGRGSAKTTMVTGNWIKHKVDEMPRSTGGLVGQSFTDLETKILPAIFTCWDMQGMEIDVDYIYGKKPPADWDKPLTPILDHTHVISFPNGSCVELISMHHKGSANGKSLQWLAVPEAKFMNEHQLREEIVPILRGHVKHFGKSPFYGAMLFETDKFSPNINWLLEKRKLHDENLVETILYWQLELNELILKKEQSSVSHGYLIRRKIEKVEFILAELRKKCVYFGEANAYDNIANLSESYIENMRLTLTDYEFKIAILNEDPTRAEQGFYPDRTEEHLYNIDNDDDIYKPIGVAFDYQASITPLVSFQVNDLVMPGINSLNFQHSMYVKHPLGPREAVNNFCLQHKMRPNKHVIYFFDHTAVAERPGQKTMAEEIVSYFEDNGWSVQEVYMGKAPLHSVKYAKIKEFLSNSKSKFLPIRFHQNRCASLLLSMDMTGIVEVPEKGTKKDKSKERDKNFPQEQATHFGDVFDQIVWAVLECELYPMSYGSEAFAGFRS